MCICEYNDADKVGQHLRNKHTIGAKSKKYHSNIILLSATYHDCIACGARLLRNRYEIRVHVRTKHKMRFLDYQAYRMKQLGEENATEEILADSEENTIDKGENGGSLEQQACDKSNNATVLAENAPTLKISSTWTLRDNESSAPLFRGLGKLTPV